jgi:hypothetical protein
MNIAEIISWVYMDNGNWNQAEEPSIGESVLHIKSTVAAHLMLSTIWPEFVGSDSASTKGLPGAWH